MSYLFGPVSSRRLGCSLGVDLIPEKICSFDCLYCQVGISSKKSLTRRWYIDFDRFKKEIKNIVKDKLKLDYITISGRGEPTLHKGLDKIITAIKEGTKGKYPICVITNSSLLYRKDVRRELRKADLIMPSLDSAYAKTFNKINKPCKGITFKKIVNGIISLRKEFSAKGGSVSGGKGKIWLEIMLLKGMNDSLKEAQGFKKLIEKINPDRVQLNLPVRPAAIKLELPSKKRIEQIKNILVYKCGPIVHSLI